MDRVLFLTDRVLKVLQDGTDLPWVKTLGAPSFPKVTTGFLCMGNIRYYDFTKDAQKGKISFEIFIITPELTNETALTIEKTTFLVKDILNENEDFAGEALSSEVTEINFAPPAGKTAAGASRILYNITFEDYEED